jgi:hypothetical protein
MTCSHGVASEGVFSYQTNKRAGIPTIFTDLALYNFFLVPKVKKILIARHFGNNDDIRSNTTAALKTIP